MKLPDKPYDSSIVYYRLYMNDEGEPVVVCVQNFDELDYRCDLWLTSDRFTDEGEALDALIPFRLAYLSRPVRN